MPADDFNTLRPSPSFEIVAEGNKRELSGRARCSPICSRCSAWIRSEAEED
jgi:hypothetical protein